MRVGDGAMVHLVGGQWAQLKTLAIGEVMRNSPGEALDTAPLVLFALSDSCDAVSFEQDNAG